MFRKSLIHQAFRDVECDKGDLIAASFTTASTFCATNLSWPIVNTGTRSGESGSVGRSGEYRGTSGLYASAKVVEVGRIDGDKARADD